MEHERVRYLLKCDSGRSVKRILRFARRCGLGLLTHKEARFVLDRRERKWNYLMSLHARFSSGLLAQRDRLGVIRRISPVQLIAGKSFFVNGKRYVMPKGKTFAGITRTQLGIAGFRR